MTPTPTAFPYAYATAVVQVGADLLDPTVGIPSLFTADLGVVVGTLVGVLWLFFLLRHFGVLPGVRERG